MTGGRGEGAGGRGLSNPKGKCKAKKKVQTKNKNKKNKRQNTPVGERQHNDKQRFSFFYASRYPLFFPPIKHCTARKGVCYYFFITMRAFSVLSAALLLHTAEGATKPNILFILADDLGWNDVDVHGSPQVPTPNVNAICKAGTRLNGMYAQPVCSPTRASIMSGRHVINTGVYYPFGQGTPERLNISYTLLPEYLKKLGYATHMVGKWHLGQNTMSSLPTGRGFDTYLGYWSGAEDYYQHDTSGGYDFALGTETDWSFNGTFSSFSFTDKAVEIVKQHGQAHRDSADAAPFFMYLAYQNVHWPLECPDIYTKPFESNPSDARKVICGLAAALDDGIGNVTQALKDEGLYDNTILIFSSDNGGPTDGNEGTQSNNYPLRGGKNTLWEGGTRVASCLSGPGVQSNKVWNGKMHVTDWMFTLMEAAGGKSAIPTDDFQLGDGMSVWEALSSVGESPRNWVLTEAHADNMTHHGNGLIVGDMKIVLTGSTNPANENGWFPPPGQDPTKVDYTVNCGGPAPATPPPCSSDYCLFNITADPCEYYNIAAQHPDILATLVKELQPYRDAAVPTVVPTGCSPVIKDGAWRPCDGV